MCEDLVLFMGRGRGGRGQGGVQIEFVHRKAFHDYEILEKYIAGLQLTGTEIKAIRQGKVNLKDSFCYVKDGEMWVRGMYIGPYDKAGYVQHDPYRERKLLLHKSEIQRLAGKMQERGLTVVPLRLFINERGWAKLEIALVRGRKKYDKRAVLRQREADWEARRALKAYRMA